MKRKILSLILVFAMTVSLLTVGTGAVEPTYGDTAGHWAESSIERWSGHGIIQGSNGLFDPNGQLTCAQLATILAKLLKLPAAKDAGFTDNTADAWYYDAINRCAAAGILNGNGDGTVTPEAPITRERAMVMLARALGIEPIRKPDLTKYTDAAQVSAYAQGYVAALIEAGIVGGVTADELAPQDNINRASTVTILDRAISTYADKAGATVKADGKGIVLVVADDVTVTGSVDKLLVPANDIEVTVKGSKNIDDITVTGDNSKVILDNASADNVTLDGEKSAVETKNGAKVENVSVTEDAKGATINAGSGTTVRNVENSAAGTTVTGSGTVKNVASDTDITVETKNTNVENSGDSKITVTDAKGKDSTVSSTGSGSSTVVNKETTSSGGGGSSSGGSYTPPHTHNYVYSTNWDTLVSTKKCSNNDSTETIEGIYYIANDVELGMFRDWVNGTNGKTATDFAGKTIKLMADITVSDWTPIGQKGGTKFNGTFDGNGKTVTINGIANNLDEAFDGCVGFFGAVENATVKNLTVAGNVSGKNAAGIVARVFSGATIENCVNKANVTATSKAGGIVSYAQGNNSSQYGALSSDCTIKNCKNSGEVKTTGDAATAAGGIYGWSGDESGKLKIIGCENSGAVTATGEKAAGGIVGQCRVITVENCTNNGNISSSKNAGGIIGANDTAAATIIGCHNTGTMAGAENKIGGIAGAVIGTIKNCTTTGTDVLVGTFGTTGLANTNTIELSESASIKVSAFEGNISLKNVTIDSLTDYIGTGVRQITLDNSTITTLTMTGSAALANHRTVLTRSENDSSTIGSIVVNGLCKDADSFIYIYLNGVCNSVTNNMTRSDDAETGANVCTFDTGDGIGESEGGTGKKQIVYGNPSNAEGGAQ